MSITAGLIRYSAEIFAQAKAEGTFYPPNGLDIEQCFLDRSWDELHPVLKSFGHPVSLTLNGDYGYEGGIDLFGWDESNERDHYLAFVSPPLVKEIAAKLIRVSFKQILKALPGDTRGSEYLAPRFQSLVEFYTAAAENGDCIFIHVA